MKFPAEQTENGAANASHEAQCAGGAMGGQHDQKRDFERSIKHGVSLGLETFRSAPQRFIALDLTNKTPVAEPVDPSFVRTESFRQGSESRYS